MTKTNVKELTLYALSISLVLLATAFINIRLPIVGNGGLIHLGNVPLFVIAILYGKKAGFLAGSMGMALFDLLSGWTLWAPFTFIIVGCMGYTVGLISERNSDNSNTKDFIAMVIALCIKICGYYCAEVILYGNYLTPIGSIIGNVLQVSVAIAITLPITSQLKRYCKEGGILCIN
ncbi:MAG: ECF transporter S component [Eubacteriales bacterium]